ncbi:hypothetical protein [Heyndrickxia sporothermodurans]|uniref:hypothetical protein n=1 Tax=Heyndrickxia sporothermodurans TaxID=46224 RepID=UPI00192AE36A|nr:hypothetical protein [Heyndrickxia sporothermodurans]MED3653244.1 hypothetical protein [Heyndrickxia sporothermodurans]
MINSFREELNFGNYKYAITDKQISSENINQKDERTDQTPSTRTKQRPNQYTIWSLSSLLNNSSIL